MKYTTPWQITSTAVMVSMLILFLTTHVEAQNNLSNTSEPISLEGRKALQFGVGSNLTLTSVDNAIFSYKWMTSDNRGYRLNLNVFAEYDDWNTDRLEMQQSIPNISDRNDNRITFRVSSGAEFDFLKYHQVYERLFLYTAIGPMIQFSYYNRVTTHYTSLFENDELLQTNELRVVTQDNRYGIGGSVGLGVEWFVTTSISFSGEYALRLITEYRKETTNRRATSGVVEADVDQTLFTTTLDGTGARIRLSIYF